MTAVRQYLDIVRINLLMGRGEIWFVALIQIVLTFGLILGFGYFIPDINEFQAMFLVTGTTTNMVVTVGLIMLPQVLAQSKAEGRLEYFLTLPISRELYLLGQISYVALVSLPAAGLAVVFGAWHYGIEVQADPWILAVIPLAVFSLAGAGVAMAILSPHQQITNAMTQLVVFYVLLFAPVMIPKEQLPSLLQHASVIMPPTYAADAVRATLTDLPGTHLARSLSVMAGFSVLSLGLSAAAVRRRG